MQREPPSVASRAFVVGLTVATGKSIRVCTCIHPGSLFHRIGCCGRNTPRMRSLRKPPSNLVDVRVKVAVAINVGPVRSRHVTPMHVQVKILQCAKRTGEGSFFCVHFYVTLHL